MTTAVKIVLLWITCSFLGAFVWALASMRRQLQQMDDDPVIFEDPDDRAVRERALNETLAIIDDGGISWDRSDSAWLSHPSNGLTDQQIRQICDQIHTDIRRLEHGEQIQ